MNMYFLSVRRLVNLFMISFPQFTVLPSTARAQFYGKLMVYLSRGLVGRLTGYVRSYITLAGMIVLQSSVDME